MQYIFSKSFLLFCILSLFVIGPFYAQQEMWMSTTDENILKRASKQQKALYQLPIGHQLLETLQAVGPNTLLLGLRENSPQLKFSEYWLVQADSGSILWRYPCDKGEYSAFWVSDSNIVLKKDEKKKISLIGLDLDTGNAL